MAVISSSVGSQAAIQSAAQQLKVQQAKQGAERAEAVARSLRARASEAQGEADRAQENARTLTVQSDRAHSVAGQARQGLAMMRSVGEMQSSLVSTVDQVVERSAVREVAQKQGEAPAPVRNTSGQLTGVVVNTTA